MVILVQLQERSSFKNNEIFLIDFNGLEYDPETGAIFRDGVLLKWFALGNKGRYLGKKINGKMIYKHRLAFYLMVGRWPYQIDHINLDFSDNRWCNLRETNASLNMGNTRKSPRNTSGLKGITWHRGKWQSSIGAGPTIKYIGRYDCPAAAHLAYMVEADKRYGSFARG